MDEAHSAADSQKAADLAQQAYRLAEDARRLAGHGREQKRLRAVQSTSAGRCDGISTSRVRSQARLRGRTATRIRETGGTSSHCRGNSTADDSRANP